MYSRLTYFGIKAETSENVAVKPDVFLGITGLDVVTDYLTNPSSPIYMDRNTKINPVKGPIDAPNGSVTVQIEPKGFGYFLKAVFGAVTSGRYFAISGVTGTFQVGETITGGTSSATATVLAISEEGDYLIMGSPTGTFTAAGEAITGGTSGATATLGVNAGTVYGHVFKAPQNSLPTFTVEVGYENEAYRFTGVRFPSFNSINQEDNIITAEIALFARAEYKFARVTAAVTSGSGSKTIPLDQTQGLVTSDSIKVYRPGTGYLDFSASSVKTHSIGSISADTSITVTNLQTSLQAGDILVLAPQTPSYSTGKELSWIGGSIARIADSITSVLSGSGSCFEEFELVITNEMEARHGANATSLTGRFPCGNYLKGFMGNGTLNRAYTNPSFLDRLRNATKTALQVYHVGDQIGATGVYYKLDWRMPNCIFQSWQPTIEDDALLDEEMPFDFYRDTAAGYTAKALLVTDVTTY